MKKWKCTVCGYIHEGEEPPETCPVCGADKSKFIDVTEPEAPAESEDVPEEATAPPSSAGSPQTPAAGAGEAPDEPEPSAPGPRDRLGELITRHHAHPITVHVPNGVLPITVLFVLIALLSGCSALETAALCNMVIVLLAMPAVLFTGYKNWQYKYNGARTDVFFTKILCGILVTGLSAFLLIWWIIDPQAATGGGSAAWIFLLLHLIALLFAVIAGLMGGKLVFRE